MRKAPFFVAIGVMAAGGSMVVLSFSENDDKNVDPADLTPQQERYCDKVEQWYREEMLDVKEKWRLGQPDTRGVYRQWCSDR